MIVLREEDKKRIEEELKKEQEEKEKEEKRKEEERKKELEREKEELLRMRTVTKKGGRVHSESVARADISGLVGRSGGGFSGDPHFLIPIRPDFFICFDWDGENGEVKFLYLTTLNLPVLTFVVFRCTISFMMTSLDSQSMVVWLRHQLQKVQRSLIGLIFHIWR